MRKLLSFVLVLIIGNVYAQTPNFRAQSRRLPAKKAVPVKTQTTAPNSTAPVFLARPGAASINEMMLQPPAFSYGSSINIWVITDGEDKQIREVSITGHGDSPTCRHVSGKVMSAFLEKYREPEDLFVAGAAHLVNRGNTARKMSLSLDPNVKAYEKAEKDLNYWRIVAQLLTKAPGTGTKDKSALEEVQDNLDAIEQELEKLREYPAVQEYIRETRSATALTEFVNEVQGFSQRNGLVIVHEIPYKLIKDANTRLTSAIRSGLPAVIAFDDLLKESKSPEAAFITPVMRIATGRPLQLRIPLARLSTTSFGDVRRSNRNDVESAIIGNARQRLAVYYEAKKRALESLEICRRIPPERMGEIVTLSQITTTDGIVYKTDKPERITREAYCKVRLPLNIAGYNEWIRRAKDIIARVDEDEGRKSKSRIQDFNDSTLIDSMLRNWRLPVARSQETFDNWRQSVRGPVWASLTQQLQQMGIASNLIGGEQMIFQIQSDGTDIIINPLHVIDMARSVVAVDQAAGITRVLDAWSLHSTEALKGTNGTQPSQDLSDLVHNVFAKVDAGNPDGAREQLETAFSLNPGATFKQLEQEWLSLFPDRGKQLIKMQQEMLPVVGATEWYDALVSLESNPAYKENFKDYIAAFQNTLESYPKMPVDPHLKFALTLATAVADAQMAVNKKFSSSQNVITPWEVIEAYSQPLPVSATTQKPSAATLQKRRKTLEASLQHMGLRGKTLTQSLGILESIEVSENSNPFRQDNYLVGRKMVSVKIMADPASLILQAIQTVQKRDPVYWEQARKERNLPKEPSPEWLAGDKATQHQLTLFESSAIALLRMEDSVRKSYLGDQAARYLWSTSTPDLKSVLSTIDAAVGDGSTGSSSAYLGPQARVKLFLEQNRKMDTLTRAQNANSLQSGSDDLLNIARARVAENGFLPFRDDMILKARAWFASGNYLEAFKALFVDTVPIALYHPNIQWEALSGDAVRLPLSVKARRQNERIIFAAEFEEGSFLDVLAVEGIPDKDMEMLLKEFTEIKNPSWRNVGKVSDQILMTLIKPRLLVQNLHDFLSADSVRLRVLKSMIYGRIAPGEEYLQKNSPAALEQSVTVVDQVKGDQGIRFKIPSLSEVKQAASNKLSRQN